MKTFHIPHQKSAVTALAWDPTGQFIAGACEDGMMVVWIVASGQVIFCRRMARRRLLTVTWSENGRCLALGGENNVMTVVQVSDGTIVLSHLFDAPVKKISFAPRGGRFLVAAGSIVYVYDEQRQEPLQLVQPSPLLDVSWSPTGARFAAVCQHGDVFVYNVLRRSNVFTLNSVYEPRSVAWNTDGRDLAIGTSKGSIQMHNGSTGCQYTTYALSRYPIVRLAWGHPCLAVMDECAEVTLWDLLPRERSVVLTRRYSTTQQALALSPNGEHIATGTQQNVCVASAG